MDKRSSVEKLDFAIDVQVAPAFVKDVSKGRLRQVAEAVLRHENTGGQLTLVITDDVGIRELNRDFLGIDAPTDVLSFNAQGATGPFVIAPEETDYLGDVIVSYPYAKVQAADLGHPVEHELDVLVAHGVLHLLGYDHVSEEEQTVMWEKQDAILREV